MWGFVKLFCFSDESRVRPSLFSFWGFLPRALKFYVEVWDGRLMSSMFAITRSENVGMWWFYIDTVGHKHMDFQ